MNTTESMKDLELKYMPMATQIFIVPLLFPYFYESGLIFFPRGTTLSPNHWHTDMASREVTAPELCTTEIVVDGAAHGTPQAPARS